MKALLRDHFEFNSIVWLAWLDSNQLPVAYQTTAHPDVLHAINRLLCCTAIRLFYGINELVSEVGFEPTTTWFQTRGSARLSYTERVEMQPGLEPG